MFSITTEKFQEFAGVIERTLSPLFVYLALCCWIKRVRTGLELLSYAQSLNNRRGLKKCFALVCRFLSLFLMRIPECESCKLDFNRSLLQVGRDLIETVWIAGGLIEYSQWELCQMREELFSMSIAKKFFVREERRVWRVCLAWIIYIDLPQVPILEAV